MNEEEIRKLVESEVTRQLAPVIAAVIEFSRKAQIGFRTIANGAQALQGGSPKASNYTIPCPHCGKEMVALSDTGKGMYGNCPNCGQRWALY